MTALLLVLLITCFAAASTPIFDVLPGLVLVHRKPGKVPARRQPLA